MPRSTPHPHAFPHIGEILAEFGPQPLHTIPHRAGSLEIFGTQGLTTQNPPTPARTRGGGVISLQSEWVPNREHYWGPIYRETHPNHFHLREEEAQGGICPNITPSPPVQDVGPGGRVNPGGSGYPMGPLPAQGLAGIWISDATSHAFAAALQGVVAALVGAALHSPSPVAPPGRDAALLLLHLRFTCGVAKYEDLPPLWEEVDRVKGRT